ncbi:inosine-adenosine-guanosine-nucleoside hydrolase [Ectocarpus siliculosus]|uniref:Inosine-adenosine-guanosine-nucleoside hydrolase n=1 Tax=Ectocarpus siliculosus TaxID=2880 RepID=D8LM07_ECTSI|nr:inosine-adenosine-guanosine-nucleoside hydrolase [Ectocarpus siliculosus]|eukprot:CBN77221.1 inosine-adenosine-guanosine-nucleoside hydrolase [Ectocarpus siliculosus]
MSSMAAAAVCSPHSTLRTPRPVYLDHDGGNDDYVALVYLLKHENRFDLLGVSVTPANSWWKVGAAATRKILRTLSKKHASSSSSSGAAEGRIPVAESTLDGVNTFPDAWRHDACKLNLLPQLNGFETEEEALRLEKGEDGISGQLLLAQTLLASESPVTVVATGPLTNLAWVLDNFPEASRKIDKVLIMGGAIDVPGNVFADDVEGFDGSAEWNIFWDPPAAKRVWDSDLELVLTPLDATNEVPITKETLLRALAGAHLLETETRPFFAWDLLTVAQLVHPELFTTSQVECDVVVGGASQGRTVRTATTARATAEAAVATAGRPHQQQRSPPAGNEKEDGTGRRGGEDTVSGDVVSTGGAGAGAGGRTVTVIRARDPKELVDVILADLCSSCDGGGASS